MSNIYNNISQTLCSIAPTCGWNPQTGFSRNAQRVMYITASAGTVVIVGVAVAALYQTGALDAGANRLSSLASTISQKYNTFSFTKTAPSAAFNSSITSLPATTASESSSAPDASSSRDPTQGAPSEGSALTPGDLEPQALPAPATEISIPAAIRSIARATPYARVLGSKVSESPTAAASYASAASSKVSELASATGARLAPMVNVYQKSEAVEEANRQAVCSKVTVTFASYATALGSKVSELGTAAVAAGKRAYRLYRHPWL
jgi:hypothetical protein